MEDGTVVTDNTKVSSTNISSETTSSTGNYAPSISGISDQQTEIGSAVRNISFTVDESEIPSSNEEDYQTVTVTATSSNTALVPNSNIVINLSDSGFSDASTLAASVDVHPAAGLTGTTTITLTVRDDAANSKQSQTSFNVTFTNPLTDLSSSLSLGMILWIKAEGGVYSDPSATIPTSNTGSIMSWHDQSGNGAHISTIVGDPNLIVSSSDLNNKAVIRFDGNDAFQLNTLTAGNFTIISVFDINANGIVYELGPQTGTNDGLFLFTDSNATIHVSKSGADSSKKHSASWGADGNPKIVSHVYSGFHNTHSLFVNGSPMLSMTDGFSENPGSTNITGKLNIGSRNGVSNFITGDLAELIIYDRELSISERQKLETYLGLKYKISTTPTNNQMVWLRADEGAKSDSCGGTDAINNDTVACWEDQSGNNNNALGINPPTYVENSLNSLPSLEFDGTTTYLQIPSSATMVADTELTSFAVATGVSGTIYRNTSSSYMLNYNNTNYLRFSFNSDFGKGIYDRTTEAHSTNAFDLISSYFGYGFTGVDVAGESLQVSALERRYLETNSMDTTGSTLRIGTRNDAVHEFLDGNIAELMLYDSEISEHDKQRTVLYLGEKYGLDTSTKTPLNYPGLKLWLQADAGLELNRGYSASFVPSNKYLRVADSAALSVGNDDFTIATWVYLDTKYNFQAVLGKWDTSTNNSEYQILYHQSNDRFYFNVTSDGTNSTLNALSASSFGPPAVNKWYFIVAWHDATADTINIQVNDGTVNSVAHTTGIFDGTADFNVGAQNNGASTFLDGRVARTGIWNRVLTATERTQLYNGGSGLPFSELGSLDDANLQAYYNLDEATGTRANDANPGTLDLLDANNNVGQLEGPQKKLVTWKDQSPFNNDVTRANTSGQPIWILDGGAGFNNKPVVRFDGADVLQNANITEFHFDQNAKITMMAVFRRLSGQPSQGYILTIGGGTGRVWFGGNSTASPSFSLFHNQYFGSGFEHYVSLGSVNENQAYLVGWKFNKESSQQYGYLNGTEFGPESLSNIANDAAILNIGNLLKGDIAELLIYFSELTTAQRQAVECYLSSKYNLGISGC